MERQEKVQRLLARTLLVALSSLVLSVTTTTFGIFGQIPLGLLQVVLSAITSLASLAAVPLVYQSASSLGDPARTATVRAAAAAVPFFGLMIAAGELGRLGNARLERGHDNDMLGVPTQSSALEPAAKQ